MDIPKSLITICNTLAKHGGRALLAGGCVRDSLLNESPKDWDLEVYGLSLELIQKELSSMGKINAVGKSFGVLKLRMDESEEFDIAVPRREEKTGHGHKGFTMIPDPRMSVKEAAGRRDFTINAIYFDPLTSDLIDPWEGRLHLDERILKPVSPRFKEDPLRVLRGMQFAARFNLTCHPSFIEMAKEVHDSFHELAPERVYTEFEKWASKSVVPSRGLTLLKLTGWIEHFPQLNRLINCPQDPEYHPEGDVFTHTLYCCDALAEAEGFKRLQSREKVILMLAMLGHDFGKPDTTEMRLKKGRMRISAHGHEPAGVPHLQNFLRSIKAPNEIAEVASPLVKEHLAHAQFYDEVSDKAVRRLAKRIQPANLTQLCLLMQADQDGRPPLPKGRGPGIANLKKAISRLNVQAKPPDPWIQGRDLLSLGMVPGPEMGKLLKRLYNLQLDGEFESPEHALHGAQGLLEKVRFSEGKTKSE